MHVTRRDARSGRIYWGALAFLAGFAALLVFVCFWYLFPSLDAAQEATPREKKQLAAYARLLLAIILIILFAGMLLTLRVGRFFLPGPLRKKVQTKYVDAWAEAGKRMQPPPPG